MSMVCYCDQCGRYTGALFGIHHTWLDPDGFKKFSLLRSETGEPVTPKTENYRGLTIKHYCSENCLNAARLNLLQEQPGYALKELR